MAASSRILFGLLLAASTVASAAQAQEETSEPKGAALIESCRRDAPECAAYLQGMADALTARNVICGAPGNAGARLRQIYLLWAESETYLRDEHRAAGADDALRRAWPCPPVVRPSAAN